MACKYYIDNKVLTELEVKNYIGENYVNKEDIQLTTLGDLSDLLAYSNSKLILPGYEVEYTTPDNMKFKTYQEASNHISELTKNAKDVDLDNLNLNRDSFTNIPAFANNFERDGWQYRKKWDNTWERKQEGDLDYSPVTELAAKKAYHSIFTDKAIDNTINQFISKNKEYEQSKEIIEEWKKVNNIQYNPEEIYSRGQEFSSVVGAYSSFDVNLMMQNLLSHIEDNEKAGGKFAISAFTKPVDKTIGHLEGGGGKIKFKINPKSEDILWAANTDVYSGSVWDASEKVNKDKKSELLGVSYTKYPSLSNVNSIQPNLAAIVDDLSHHHNELGISLTGNNFRLEYDENIPYSTKKIINSINSILDQKYGKLVKPNIENKQTSKESYSYNDKIFDKLEMYEQDGTYIYELTNTKTGEKSGQIFAKSFKRINDKYGIQPTQTNETLKESIDSVNSKFKNLNNGLYIPKEGQEIKVMQDNFYKATLGKYRLEAYDINTGKALYGVGNEVFDTEKEAKDFLAKAQNQKEYTSQALTNTKIAKLKEVAKKHPRSLIRSEVKSIKASAFAGSEMYNAGFDPDELPFQKLSKSPKEILQEKLNEQVKNNKRVVLDTTNLTKDKRLPFIEAIKKAIPTANIQYKLMELNPELAKQRIKAQLARGENRANVSDETIDRHATSYKQMLEDIKSEPITPFIDKTNTKTRRILEVQSDLFQKGRDKENLISKKGKHYRVLNTNIGNNVTFQPNSYSEAFEQGEDGKWYPKISKYGGYWKSNIAEISASKSIGAAVMGNWTASGMPKDSKFYIYELEDNVQPDYDISNLEIGDFKQLQEVRYRKPVNGKLIGEFNLIPETYNIFSENYDLMSEDGGINKHYELEDKFEKEYGYRPYDEKAPEGSVDKFNTIQDKFWKDAYLKVEKVLQSIHNKYDESFKQNQFLQLLNKDNNWVTFFVKSIIQDTAKQTITEVQQEDVEAKVRELEKEGLLEIDCKGKLKAEDGIATLFEKGGNWEIITDFKNAPTHKSGGKDISIQGKKVEVEKNELRIENDFGDIAIIPSKYKVEVKDAIKSNCHSCIDGIVESLPKMKDYAGDGTVFPFFGRYKRFKNSLPDNLKNTSEDEYAMRYYWKHNNKPKSFDEAIKKEQPMFTMEDDGYYHAPSVESNTLRFLKPKNHPTLQYELDWYNSDNPDAVDFRNKYDLDTSGRFYKYVPKKLGQ